MNLAKINEAIRDLENQCKVAVDNESIVESVCRLLECIPAEITDKVRALCQANLGFDDNLAEAEKNREAIEREAVCIAIEESIVNEGHVLYESEPELETDSYGDEVTIRLNAYETNFKDHISNALATWEDWVDEAQYRRRKRDEDKLVAKQKADALLKKAEEDAKIQQQGNCSEGV